MYTCICARKMFLLLYYSLSVASFTSNNNIFRGVEDLDQELEEDIAPGGDVSFAEFPYVAAVFNALRKSHTCTGAIIHRRIVVTAGYCVSQGEEIADPAYVSVLGGVVDMRDHDRDQWRYAEAIAASNDTYKNAKTLVLIKVNAPFFLNYSLKTIKCSTHRQRRNGPCTAVTWRFRDRLNRLTLKSLVLKQYSVYVLNQSYCESLYSSNPIFYGFGEIGFVCMNFVAFVEPGTLNYECVGVDGSMIFCEDSGELHPVGVATTFVGGSTCNRADVPYVFFDLGASFEWIRNEMLKLLTD